MEKAPEKSPLGVKVHGHPWPLQYRHAHALHIRTKLAKEVERRAVVDEKPLCAGSRDRRRVDGGKCPTSGRSLEMPGNQQEASVRFRDDEGKVRRGVQAGVASLPSPFPILPAGRAPSLSCAPSTRARHTHLARGTLARTRRKSQSRLRRTGRTVPPVRGLRSGIESAGSAWPRHSKAVSSILVAYLLGRLRPTQ